MDILDQWKREINRKHREQAEQRAAFIKRRRLGKLQTKSQKLRRIKLTEDEKQKLRAKIAEAQENNS